MTVLECRTLIEQKLMEERNKASAFRATGRQEIALAHASRAAGIEECLRLVNQVITDEGVAVMRRSMTP